MTEPNMIIVGEAQYAEATRRKNDPHGLADAGRRRVAGFAGRVPELKNVTLAEFIRDCPYQIEFTLGDPCPKGPKATKEDRR